ADTTGNYVATITNGAGISGSSSSHGGTPTIAVDSTQQNFLTSGALTCGASTNGKMKVHTTPLQYCDNAATPTLQYAAYGNSSGAATSVAADSVPLGTGTTGNYVATITNGAGISGSASSEGATPTIAVDSTQQNFLTSGALTCGASTAGKMK